ncbi:MAG: glycosyltransferase family 39 protein [Alphaproteobacteria bacterium]|nr:glycosyltransferase family 39 protein [Alphaproteobacteria bacterium]
MAGKSAGAGAPAGTAGLRPLFIVAAACAAVAFFHQVLTLGRQGLWGDEIFTVVAADPARPLGEMFERYLLPDVHPPLHYLLMRAWLMAAPHADWAMRVPGLVAYAMTVAAAAVYPCRALGPVPRAVFTLLAATSFGTIYFAQEARSYHLLALLAVAILYDMLDHDAAIRNGMTPRWRRLSVSAALGIVASYTHYYGFLFCGAAVIVLIVAALPRWTVALRFVAVGAAIVAAFAPWIALHAGSLAGQLGGAFWIDNAPGAILRGFLRHLLSGAPAAALIAALCLWAAQRRGPALLRDRSLLLVVAAAAITVAVAVALSFHTPTITARNLTMVRIALLLAIAMVIAEVATARLAWVPIAAAGAALFAGFVIGAVPRASWREPMAHLRAATSCAHREILFHDGKGLTPDLAAYYLPEERFAFRRSGFGGDFARELASLNAAAPGCDIVAIALNLDPANPAERAALAAAVPRTGYRLEEWPSALVVRAAAP